MKRSVKFVENCFVGQQKQECAATSAELKSTGKRKVTVGSVWRSNKCGEFEVVNYQSALSVTVRFSETGFETVSTAGNIRRGEVKDKLSRSVYGVGIVGNGDCLVSKNGKQVREYKVWQGMIERCYDKSSRAYQHYGMKGICVCEEWHNYQNFAKWYYDNYPKDGISYQLDKDLKVIGNKVYSPETCMFVSSKVNSFTLCRDKLRGDFFIGVNFDKRSGRFVAMCNNSFTSTNEYLGCFSCELKAHLAWRKRKSELAYELAMIQDRDEVKHALLNWKEALDNNLIHPY